MNEEGRNEDGSIKKNSDLGELIVKIAEAKKAFDEEHGDLILADDFKFPLTVSSVIPRGLSGEPPRPDVGNLVKVRPVGDEKTYLGVLLGDFIVGVEMGLGSKSGALFVTGMRNPAIYIPALRRVVWGRGSWWAEVSKEDDLSKLITDEVIGEIWYVKALKMMFGLANDGDTDEEKTTDVLDGRQE